MVPAYKSVSTDALQIFVGKMRIDIHAKKKREEYLLGKEGIIAE